MRVFAVLILSVVLAGCGFNPIRDWARDTVDSTSTSLDPNCEALKTVAIDISNVPPIDFADLKDVEFTITEIEGRRIIFMNYEDHTKMLKALKLIENHIKLEKNALKSIQQYYEQNLDRQEVH